MVGEVYCCQTYVTRKAVRNPVHYLRFPLPWRELLLGICGPGRNCNRPASTMYGLRENHWCKMKGTARAQGKLGCLAGRKPKAGGRRSTIATRKALGGDHRPIGVARCGRSSPPCPCLKRNVKILSPKGSTEIGVMPPSMPRTD